MNIQRIAAFTYNNQGGNPAGVVLVNTMPSSSDMLSIAKDVGYSETAFLQQVKDGWRIRFFAPEMEVPFCGHATIASGAALGDFIGSGEYRLFLNSDEISIKVSEGKEGNWSSRLQSPPTWSDSAPEPFVNAVLETFNLNEHQLHSEFPVRFAFAGAKHLILVLKDKQLLSDMNYQFEDLKFLMASQDLVTINLLWPESTNLFHSRNPFPPGGVYEDPATGAAAAAFAGYLRDIEYKCDNHLEIIQGHDMGVPSRILVRYSNIKGEGIHVSGETRKISV